MTTYSRFKPFALSLSLLFHFEYKNLDHAIERCIQLIRRYRATSPPTSIHTHTLTCIRNIQVTLSKKISYLRLYNKSLCVCFKFICVHLCPTISHQIKNSHLRSHHDIISFDWFGAKEFHVPKIST